jgi:hypothetical protein
MPVDEGALPAVPASSGAALAVDTSAVALENIAIELFVPACFGMSHSCDRSHIRRCGQALR